MQPNSAVEIFNNWTWLLSGNVLGMSRVWTRIVDNFGIARTYLLPDGSIAARSSEGVIYEAHPRVLLSAIYFGHRVVPRCGTAIPVGVAVPELDECIPNISKIVRGAPVILDFVCYEVHRDCSISATEAMLNYAGETVSLSLISLRHMYAVLRHGTDYPC